MNKFPVPTLTSHCFSLLANNTLDSSNCPFRDPPSCHGLLIWATNCTSRTIHSFACSLWCTVMMIMHKGDNVISIDIGPSLEKFRDHLCMFLSTSWFLVSTLKRSCRNSHRCEPDTFCTSAKTVSMLGSCSSCVAGTSSCTKGSVCVDLSICRVTEAEECVMIVQQEIHQKMRRKSNISEFEIDLLAKPPHQNIDYVQQNPTAMQIVLPQLKINFLVF